MWASIIFDIRKYIFLGEGAQPSPQTRPLGRGTAPTQTPLLHRAFGAPILAPSAFCVSSLVSGTNTTLAAHSTTLDKILGWKWL